MNYAFAFAVHIAVLTFILLCALLAATTIRPLMARTRHTILIAGMTALVLPPALFATLVEKTEPLRRLAGTIAPFDTATINAMPRADFSVPWLKIITIAWLAIAAIALLRWIIVTQRLTLSALRIAGAPPARAIAALDAARRRLSLHRSVDLITSPLCEAPAVIRVVRPLIILPAHGCDALDDDELESLLCHECAHVARHDNLLGVIEAIIAAVFWFNPVVWMARRQLAIVREAACDELVADTASRAETYVGALAKFCSSLVAPRIPAVSCMTNAHLKERIQHIMRYDSLKIGALSHRAIAATSTLLVALFVVGAGVATATPESKLTATPYQLNYSLAKSDDGSLIVHMKIVNTKTNEVLGEPTIITKGDIPSTTEVTRRNVRLRIEVDPTHGAGGQIEMLAYEDDKLVRRVGYALDPNRAEHEKGYSGDKISLDLEDADVKDVLRTFAKLTGYEMTIDDDVNGKLTIQFADTPWDEALDRIIKDNGLAYTLDGKKMHISVKR